MKSKTIDAALHKKLEDIKAEISRSVVDKKHPWRQVVLSTVSDKNIPQSRIVILRSFEKNNFNFLFYTDARSAKISDLEGNKHVQLLLWHSKKKIQVRLSGMATVHHGDELNKAHWEKAQNTPLDYNAAMPPGTVVNDPEIARAQKTEITSDFFIVLQVSVFSIDLLELSREGHSRAAFQFENGLLIDANWLVA